MMMDILTSIAALGLVIGLIFGLAWFLRRFRLTPVGLPQGRKREMVILESQMIDTRNRIILVAWRGTEYLLASGEQGVRRIDKKPAENAGKDNQTKTISQQESVE